MSFCCIQATIDKDILTTEERSLFKKLDKNNDYFISEEEFREISKILDIDGMNMNLDFGLVRFFHTKWLKLVLLV